MLTLPCTRKDGEPTKLTIEGTTIEWEDCPVDILVVEPVLEIDTHMLAVV